MQESGLLQLFACLCLPFHSPQMDLSLLGNRTTVLLLYREFCTTSLTSLHFQTRFGRPDVPLPHTLPSLAQHACALPILAFRPHPALARCCSLRCSLRLAVLGLTRQLLVVLLAQQLVEAEQVAVHHAQRRAAHHAPHHAVVPARNMPINNQALLQEQCTARGKA